MTTETRKRRNYTEDFKRDAVALVTEQGYKTTEAARSLGSRTLAKNLRKEGFTIGRDRTRRLIHYSDRGSQYASQAYQKLLKQYGMIPSMSRKGNCWDNAPVDASSAV